MSRELLARALDALGTSTWDHACAVGKQELIDALRSALAAPQPQPGHDCSQCRTPQACRSEQMCLSTLYLGQFPPAAPAPAVREPLKDEQIYEMYNEPRSDAEMVAFARAIEQAHGIGGGK